MPTVRKTTPGTVTIHDAGTFHQGTTRDVPKDTADYLVEDRSDFERVHDGGTGAFPSEEDATDVEYTETSEDATNESESIGLTEGLETGDNICTCDVDDACDACNGRCPTVKSDGDVCGRKRPCGYHDEDGESE